MGSPSSERSDAPARSPYLGLSPYDEDDARVFFGRRQERDLVVANLLTSRLTVLYGPSGVGKSSLLHAGVLPRLRAGDGLPSGGSPRQAIVVDAWHADPVRTVVGAVANAAGDGISADASLDAALAAYGERTGGILLLLLDQFEDYFLYHGARGDALLSELPLAFARGDVRSRLLISLREDALADLDRFGASPSALFANLVRLGPLSESAARAAIAGPLDGDAMTLEAGLEQRVIELLRAREPGAGVARGLRDVDRGGVEPAYLQLVMRELWDREVRSGSSQLRLATLASMGSLRAVVSRHLRTAMARLSTSERRRMAEAFRYLVTPSGAKIAQSRRDLAELTGEREDRLAAPLAKLAAADARILRPVDDAPSYQVFHDVLAQPLLDWRARFRAAQLQRRAAALGALTGAAAAVVLALSMYALAPDWLQKAELRTVDARFGLRGEVAPEADIALVDLDDASLAALAGDGRRPPRSVHARMIDALREAGAAVIAYDFEFREPMPGDATLRSAIERAGPQLLLAVTRIDSEGEGEVFGESGGELSASVGYAGFPIAIDGAYRQVDESVGLSGAEQTERASERLPSFAVVAAELAGYPPERFRRAWIDYHGDAGTYRARAFVDVLRDADRSELDGKLVVVGASARALGDVHPTAHGDGRSMSGAEIHANAISTLLRGRPLRELHPAADIALIVLLGLAPALLLIAAPRWAAVLVAVVAVAYLALAQAVFGAGRIVPVVNPLLALVAAAVAVVAVRVAIRRRALVDL